MSILSRGSIFLLFLVLSFPVGVSGSSDIIINEIAWMGTEKDANDEWMELYNNSNAPVSLEDWVLKSATGTPKIVLKGIIPTKGFYLLERTDDDTVLGISADLIYSGALKNSGEGIGLYNNLSGLVDSAFYPDGWLAGDNQTKQTMERTLSGWQTSQDPGGTPKAENSIIITAEGKTQKTTEEKNYPLGIVINEILPSPEGPDNEKEWIELFNQNDFEVDVSGWQISDVLGTTKTYTFPTSTKISPKGIIVLYRPTTKITLNNDGDGLRIIHPDGKIIDSVNYEKASIGSSYNRLGSEWFWSSIPTPGLINQTSSSEKDKEEMKKDQENQDNLQNKGLAQISEPIKEIGSKKDTKILFNSFIALTVSLFSGIVILTLKKKLKSTN